MSVSIENVVAFVKLPLLEEDQPQVIKKLLKKLAAELDQLEGFEGNSLALVVTTENANENTSSHNGPVHVVGEGTSLNIKENVDSPLFFGNVHNLSYRNGSNSYSSSNVEALVLTVINDCFCLFLVANLGQARIFSRNFQGKITDGFSVGPVKLPQKFYTSTKYDVNFLANAASSGHIYGNVVLSYNTNTSDGYLCIVFQISNKENGHSYFAFILSLKEKKVLEELRD